MSLVKTVRYVTIFRASALKFSGKHPDEDPKFAIEVLDEAGNLIEALARLHEAVMRQIQTPKILP
jgi:hypothetical protein